MAELTNAQRRDVYARFMRENREPFTLAKASLRLAVDAADAWLDANAASFNTAIPQPARAALSTAQKARLLSMVALKRFGG